jgi:hypothetical protein
MVIYNLELFCIEHIIRPYLSTFDERTWLVCYKKENLTEEQIREWSKLKQKYEKSVYRVDGLNRWVNMLESRKDWAKQVFERLKNIDFEFYKHLDKNNCLIKCINRHLGENN